MATRAGGIVRIEAEAGDERVTLRVKDNGPGVRRDLREQVFEPFFTAKSGHLGLGLAIARGMVRAYGGRIWYARSKDHWTTFTVEFPLGPPASTSAFRPVPLTLRRARSVLVVDDDAAVRTTIRRFLE
ncbi:MAG TPA: ATP-binding protein [Longimicrobiales bacterium]